MRVPFLVASLLLFGAGVARAEGSLENVSVVVSRRAAESLACTSPKASLYLQGTLRDIAERRWGMVTTSLQSDTADLVADAVYESVRTGRNDVFASFEPQAESACASPLHRQIITDVDRCVHRPLADRRRDPACALAAAVRGALDGDVPTARLNVADLIAVSTFDGVYTGAHLSESQKDRLFEHVAIELRAAMAATLRTRTIRVPAPRRPSLIRPVRTAISSARCPTQRPIRTLASAPRRGRTCATTPSR